MAAQLVDSDSLQDGRLLPGPHSRGSKELCLEDIRDPDAFTKSARSYGTRSGSKGNAGITFAFFFTLSVYFNSYSKLPVLMLPDEQASSLTGL